MLYSGTPTLYPKSTVTMQAPAKPSIVFFGLRLRSFLLPKRLPQRYAAVSFIIIREHGNKNLSF